MAKAATPWRQAVRLPYSLALARKIFSNGTV